MTLSPAGPRPARPAVSAAFIAALLLSGLAIMLGLVHSTTSSLPAPAPTMVSAVYTTPLAHAQH